MNEYTLKYKDEFGILHTSQYPDKGHFDFWKNIRIAQGYILLIETDTEFNLVKDEPNQQESIIL